MAKWCGKIGYAVTKEIRPGYWDSTFVEREYFGDLTRNSRRFENSQANGKISISNEISIVADPFAYENFHSMRWVEFMGVKWTINSVEVQHPRLILSLGDVYNDCDGEETEATDNAGGDSW